MHREPPPPTRSRRPPPAETRSRSNATKTNYPVVHAGERQPGLPDGQLVTTRRHGGKAGHGDRDGYRRRAVTTRAREGFCLRTPPQAPSNASTARTATRRRTRYIGHRAGHNHTMDTVEDHPWASLRRDDHDVQYLVRSGITNTYLKALGAPGPGCSTANPSHEEVRVFPHGPRRLRLYRRRPGGDCVSFRRGTRLASAQPWQPDPVNVAEPPCASTIPSCRCSRSSSAEVSLSTTSAAVSPWRRSASPSGP
jgi:hypothetical protein